MQQPGRGRADVGLGVGRIRCRGHETPGSGGCEGAESKSVPATRLSDSNSSAKVRKISGFSRFLQPFCNSKCTTEGVCFSRSEPPFQPVQILAARPTIQGIKNHSKPSNRQSVRNNPATKAPDARPRIPPRWTQAGTPHRRLSGPLGAPPGTPANRSRKDADAAPPAAATPRTTPHRTAPQTASAAPRRSKPARRAPESTAAAAAQSSPAPPQRPHRPHRRKATHSHRSHHLQMQVDAPHRNRARRSRIRPAHHPKDVSQQIPGRLRQQIQPWTDPLLVRRRRAHKMPHSSIPATAAATPTATSDLCRRPRPPPADTPAPATPTPASASEETASRPPPSCARSPAAAETRTAAPEQQVRQHQCIEFKGPEAHPQRRREQPPGRSGTNQQPRHTGQKHSQRRDTFRIPGCRPVQPRKRLRVNQQRPQLPPRKRSHHWHSARKQQVISAIRLIEDVPHREPGRDRQPTRRHRHRVAAGIVNLPSAQPRSDPGPMPGLRG